MIPMIHLTMMMFTTMANAFHHEGSGNNGSDGTEHCKDVTHPFNIYKDYSKVLVYCSDLRRQQYSYACDRDQPGRKCPVTCRVCSPNESINDHNHGNGFNNDRTNGNDSNNDRTHGFTDDDDHTDGYQDDDHTDGFTNDDRTHGNNDDDNNIFFFDDDFF
mmetsp:Transcript_18044/g.22721  ORF Transcript_18044/g.22721 Transcript_18044/m.22721 type:complete len:160 (-) Transcript_18044:36-515(-)